MSNLSNEFTKGLGRGLGYKSANIITDILSLFYINNYNKTLNKIKSSKNQLIRESTNLSIWFYIVGFFFIQSIFIYLPIYGIIRFNKRKVKIKTIEINCNHVFDRRYNCGYRTNYQEVIKTEKVEATEEEIKIFKKQGKIMLIISSIIWLLMIIILMII